jgi:hypothetical protein
VDDVLQTLGLELSDLFDQDSAERLARRYADEGKEQEHHSSSSTSPPASVPVPVPVPYLEGERADVRVLLDRYERGEIHADPAPTRELPAWVPPATRRVLVHMALCVALLLKYGGPADDGTVIYAVDPMGARLGLAGKTVSVALKTLRNCGAVEIVKVLEPMEGRPAGTRVYAVVEPAA